MYRAFVFHQDSTNGKYNVRATGASTSEMSAAIRMVEKAKQEGYVIHIGNKKPVWHNINTVQ